MDPDQMASSEANRSGSTLFSKKDKSTFSRTSVKEKCSASVLFYNSCNLIREFYAFQQNLLFTIMVFEPIYLKHCRQHSFIMINLMK